MDANITTETGIDVSKYISDTENKIAALAKPVPNSENYVYLRTNHSVKIVDGTPVAVEGAPTMFNINRQSIIDLESKLAAEDEKIHNLRSQLAAIQRDMDALDRIVGEQ